MTMTEPAYQQYELFQKRQKTLAALIGELEPVLGALEMSEFQEKAIALEKLVQSDTFKVLVLGEFKRGKSTFINAMLGDEILPAYARFCTAIINEVKWGESKRALLHPIQTKENSAIEPIEVPVEKLEEYVVIKDDVRETSSSQYDKVELFWPLSLCQSGVEIIDSPGLNEHDTRQKVTMDYLSSVDAVLFVLTCEALASQSELDVIDNILKPTGHEDIFFICNRFNMIRSKEKEDIKKYGRSKLGNRTTKGAEHIFFISALDGLEGRIEKDDSRVQKSGVVEVEQALEKFLSREKGKVKILRPARELQMAIYAVRRTMPKREAMLREDLKTLEDRVEEAQGPLRRLQTERRQIVESIENTRRTTRAEVKEKAASFYRSLPEQILGWVADFDAENTVSFISKEGTKAQAEKLTEEVVTYLSKKVESELLVWQKEALLPLVTKNMSELTQKLDKKTADFVEKVDNLMIQVSGSTVSADNLGLRKIGAVERVLSAAGGFVVGGVGSAGIGAVFGYQEMAKSIIPQVGIAILTIALAGFNPLFLIPAMASGGFIQGLLSTKSTNKKIKEQVGQRFAASISDSADSRSDAVVVTVDEELAKTQVGLDRGLGREIQAIQEQINSVLIEKKKGQVNVDEKLQELSSLIRKLDAIDRELDTLVAEVAMP